VTATPDKPRLFVTGACGVVFSQIADQFQDEYDVRATDVVERDGVTKVDLLDYAAVREAMEGADAVLHLAIASRRAMRHLEPHEGNDVEMRVNVTGTHHIFAAAAEAKVKRVVYMSSMTILLGDPRADTFPHDMPVRPNGLYAVTKLIGEQFGEFYSRCTNMTVVCLRLGQPVPTNVFPLGSERAAETVAAGLAIGFDDIARGLKCALAYRGASFHVAPLVSQCANVTVDMTEAERIGYHARQRFSLDGLLLPQE
jgi:uronate dehydrogenase